MTDTSAPAIDSAPDKSGDVPEGNDGVVGAEASYLHGEPGTLIVTDADRKFWVTESVITVAGVLERGQYAEFHVVSGSGTVWVNPARVVHLEEKTRYVAD